jgi:cytidylate kinase
LQIAAEYLFVGSKPVIIAIDGCSAAGKGTLSKRLASHYGFEFLDTGRMYRLASHSLLSHQVPIDDINLVISHLKSHDFLSESPADLGTEEIAFISSTIGTHSQVRSILNELQINFPNGKKGVVVDGRDIGTVIFPNADFKFYIIASLEERAKRRYNQLRLSGKTVIFDNILKDLEERDQRDSKRLIAPSVPAKDAIVIDTSHLNADSVFELLQALPKKPL